MAIETESYQIENGFDVPGGAPELSIFQEALVHGLIYPNGRGTLIDLSIASRGAMRLYLLVAQVQELSSYWMNFQIVFLKNGNPIFTLPDQVLIAGTQTLYFPAQSLIRQSQISYISLGPGQYVYYQAEGPGCIDVSFTNYFAFGSVLPTGTIRLKPINLYVPGADRVQYRLEGGFSNLPAGQPISVYMGVLT